MHESIFEFTDYKAFLKQTAAEGRRGLISELAKKIRCQPSYLSQVLTRKAHLSQEQSWLLATALRLGKTEKTYFLTMVDYAKAQDSEFKQELEKNMQRLKESRFNLKEKFQISDNLKEIDKSIYFSSYLYPAAHLLVSIDGFNTYEKIANHLNTSTDRISNIIRDLLRMGLVTEKKGRLESTTSRIHLPADSSLIIRHHTNWRVQALNSIERMSAKNLHYSALVSISKKDMDVIRSKIVDHISRVNEAVSDSKAEKCFVFNTDFFELSAEN